MMRSLTSLMWKTQEKGEKMMVISLWQYLSVTKLCILLLLSLLYYYCCCHDYRYFFITVTNRQHLSHCRSVGVSDFDLMMQRRKEAMARARRRRKKVIYYHFSTHPLHTNCLH